MAGWTNRLKFNMLGWTFRAVALPTNFYIGLFLATTAPSATTNTIADINEIAAGNGYTSGGISLAKGTVDFDVLTEDDTNNRGLVQLKDIVWTASGGPIPSSGSGARYACLTDDNATISAREVYTYWDLTSDRTISDTQTLTLQDCEIRINEV